MKAEVKRLGGSLYMIIKPSIKEDLDLKEGDLMDMQRKGKTIVIKKVEKGDK